MAIVGAQFQTIKKFLSFQYSRAKSGNFRVTLREFERASEIIGILCKFESSLECSKHVYEENWGTSGIKFQGQFLRFLQLFNRLSEWIFCSTVNAARALVQTTALSINSVKCRPSSYWPTTLVTKHYIYIPSLLTKTTLLYHNIFCLVAKTSLQSC